MQSLAAANWQHLRRISADCGPTDPLLAALWHQALAEKGQVLRISPHRTVVRVQSDGELGESDWLLKICHPRRSWERLRRKFSNPPAQREAENWRLLAHRLGIQLPVIAEQLSPRLGLFARPFWSGQKVSATMEDETGGFMESDGVQKLAKGIARLHGEHWSDPDLAADDLLYADAFGGQLIPLDLGHAKVSMLPLSAEAVHLDLERLIASLPLAMGPQLADALMEHHSDGGWLKEWSAQKLIDRALTLRQKKNWKHSARCLRTVSDFVRDERGARRRDFHDEMPSIPEMNSTSVLKSGPRSTTLKIEESAWKFYPRKGIGQSLRRHFLFGPGCLAFRKMYALELLGISVAKVQAWIPVAGGEWLATKWTAGDLPQPEHLPEIADYLARLHTFGIGLRDAKPSNFVRGISLTLIDADGIQSELRNPWRDLARVIAEVQAQSEIETACLEAYAKAWCNSLGLEAAPWDIPTMTQKCATHAQYFRQLLQKPAE